MASLSEQLGFIHGLVSSMNLEADSVNSKLLTSLVGALESVAGEIGDLRDDVRELNDFVESIDADLEDLEAVVDGDERNLEGDEEEFDEEDMPENPSFSPESGLRVLSFSPQKERRGAQADGLNLTGSLCSECGKLFFVREADLGDEAQRFVCPHCDHDVPFTPVSAENTPVARPCED